MLEAGNGRQVKKTKAELEADIEARDETIERLTNERQELTRRLVESGVRELEMEAALRDYRGMYSRGLADGLAEDIADGVAEDAKA